MKIPAIYFEASLCAVGNDHGLGFVISNACARAKATATHIVGSNDEAKFAQAIRIFMFGQL
ncbi:MAG: hypothetical protein J6X55_01325 [Victivallales bacterium]|nr:hypothetical protein [Victivallales bacterium]